MDLHLDLELLSFGKVKKFLCYLASLNQSLDLIFAMPRNRNGRKKQIDDLTEDHGLLGGADKDLEYLLSIFSDVDAEITHAVYIECKKDGK